MIDLSTLPAPQVIEPLDYEAILAALKADLLIRLPALADTLELESEPVVKLLEISAYREMTLRARINDAARGVMLAYAVGTDLDVLAANFGVARLADEEDARLRVRAQMALEGLTVAGSIGAYTFHSLSASARVADVSIESPTPGLVRVNVLAADNDGVADAPLLAEVSTYLTAETRRPLCDSVEVAAAEVLTYTIAAELTVDPGPSSAVVLTNAEAAAQAYVAQQFRIGAEIALSGIYAALHQSGVRAVNLSTPAAGIVPTARQAARCTGITLGLA